MLHVRLEPSVAKETLAADISSQQIAAEPSTRPPSCLPISSRP
jgi:hypothetical protein